MKKIIVNEEESAPDVLESGLPLSDLDYSVLANFFFQLKCIHGPEFVNATIKRHKVIANALTAYEKEYIKKVESKLIFGE